VKELSLNQKFRTGVVKLCENGIGGSAMGGEKDIDCIG
jgi:hypothetical protein